MADVIICIVVIDGLVLTNASVLREIQLLGVDFVGCLGLLLIRRVLLIAVL